MASGMAGHTGLLRSSLGRVHPCRDLIPPKVSNGKKVNTAKLNTNSTSSRTKRLNELEAETSQEQSESENGDAADSIGKEVTDSRVAPLDVKATV